MYKQRCFLWWCKWVRTGKVGYEALPNVKFVQGVAKEKCINRKYLTKSSHWFVVGSQSYSFRYEEETRVTRC